jgi:hypothetical protein
MYRGGDTAFFRHKRGSPQKEAVNGFARIRLFVRRFLGEDVSGLPVSELYAKYEEARIMREFEVEVMREAIVKAFNGGK